MVNYYLYLMFLSKTQWASESITMDNIRLKDILVGFRILKKYSEGVKLDFCAYIRNVYHIKHRIYLEFAEWIRENYNSLFGIEFREVVDMFLLHCMFKYNCELEDVYRYVDKVRRCTGVNVVGS